MTNAYCYDNTKSITQQYEEREQTAAKECVATGATWRVETEAARRTADSHSRPSVGPMSGHFCCRCER